MEVNVKTFNREIIAELMLSSVALERGIEYYKLVTGADAATAKLSAIRDAQEQCLRRWHNDTSGYLSDEYVTFREFEKDVLAGRIFYTSLSGRCPKCGSKNIEKRSKGQKVASFFLSASIFSGAAKASKTFACKDCGEKFN